MKNFGKNKAQQKQTIGSTTGSGKDASSKADLAAIDGEIKKGNSVGDKKQGASQITGQASINENESFNRHYNKELKVSEDEIPIVLLELNESALAFITREQFEKALLLLQKAHSVLDVVDLANCKRDQMIALEIFLNMALCYQKLGQLEECSLCLETCIEHLGQGEYQAEIKSQIMAMRLMKLKLECKLRMQLCAILSQLHRHKEALDQAYMSAKLGNLITKDYRAGDIEDSPSDQAHLCEFISKRVDFENLRNIQNLKNGLSTNNHEESTSGLMIDNFSNFSEDFAQEKVNQSVDSLSQYQTRQGFYNNLEDSISLAERSAKKLLPIYRELHRRLVQFKKHSNSKEKQFKNDQISDFERANDSEDQFENDIQKDTLNKGERSVSKNKKTIPDSPEKSPYSLNLLDMRHLLGFLNQSEWVTSLNIGNIMQISPIQHEDLITHRRNEQEISRDAFLESVSYNDCLKVNQVKLHDCCILLHLNRNQIYQVTLSEIAGVIISIKEEISQIPGFDIAFKTKESEYWHAKSLEIACTFLPSDCPLLNHVLLSYQKHHAPSSAVIPENASTEELLEVLKPLLGIENNKFQPIVRRLQNITVELSPINIKSINHTVKKLLKKIQPDSYINLNNQNTHQESNAQHSTAVKTPTNQNPAIQKKKIKKIMKFEKIMKKFCREISVDKVTLLTMLIGKNNMDDIISKNGGDFSSSRKDPFSQSKDNLNTKDSAGANINTGQAAQLAYNNIIAAVDPENTNQNFMRVRNQQFKSRNGNYSLSENRENQQQNLPQFITQPHLKGDNLLNRGSIGDINLNPRNYESDTSLFNEIKNNLNENSFNEQMLDKNRINFTKDTANSSIVGTILSKRQNSNDRLGSLRPRSSKGNRNASSTSSTHIPLLTGSNGQAIFQGTNPKFQMNKSEERTKSQQQSRTISSGNKLKLHYFYIQPKTQGDNFSKLLHQNLILNQQSHNQSIIQQMSQQQSIQSQQQQPQLKLGKKSQQMQNQSAIIESGQSNSQQENLNPKKNKINYEDLKKYLIKEYQSQKQQNKLQNFYLKQEDVNMILNKAKKQSNNGGRAGKLLSQQQQQQQQQLLQQNIQQQINQNSQQQLQKQIYLNQQRPISVGNMGGMKKRDKNKAIMQELLLQGNMGLNSKQKILQGAPLVGFMGNHNLSVNITNIAGNVNAIRPQQFFEDDIKNINNTNSGYIKGVNGGGGLENFLPNSKVNNLIGNGNLGQNGFSTFDVRRKSQPQ